MVEKGEPCHAQRLCGKSISLTDKLSFLVYSFNLLALEMTVLLPQSLCPICRHTNNAQPFGPSVFALRGVGEKNGLGLTFQADLAAANAVQVYCE